MESPVSRSISTLKAAQAIVQHVSIGPLSYGDRKSTRLNSSHSQISYAVFCLKKKQSMGWTSRPVPTMGGWSAAELFFENVRVPEDHILGEIRHGFSLGMQSIGHGRAIIGST